MIQMLMSTQMLQKFATMWIMIVMVILTLMMILWMRIQQEFFVDTDGDGFYGDTEGAEAVIACSSPDGYSDLEGDCDDANELINPDASEICDEVDNDCDGDIDDADDSLNEDSTTTFYLDVDGDTYGSSTLTEQALCTARRLCNQ